MDEVFYQYGKEGPVGYEKACDRMRDAIDQMLQDRYGAMNWTEYNSSRMSASWSTPFGLIMNLWLNSGGEISISVAHRSDVFHLTKTSYLEVGRKRGELDIEAVISKCEENIEKALPEIMDLADVLMGDIENYLTSKS